VLPSMPARIGSIPREKQGKLTVIQQDSPDTYKTLDWLAPIMAPILWSSIPCRTGFLWATQASSLIEDCGVLANPLTRCGESA